METEFKDLKSSWKTARAAASGQIAAASAADLTQDQAKRALELTLLKTIFTAAMTFVGQEEMGPKLFDQSRLENKNKPKPPPTP